MSKTKQSKGVSKADSQSEKGAPTPFRLWRRGLGNLARWQRIQNTALAKAAEEDTGLRMALIDMGLRINKEVRETLRDELKIRRDVIELRKLDMDGMTEEQLQGLLLRYCKRRGLASVNRIREQFVEALTPALGAEAAQQFVDRVRPAEREQEQRHSLELSINNGYKQAERDLEAGHADLMAAMGAADVTQTDSDTDEGKD